MLCLSDETNICHRRTNINENSKHGVPSITLGDLFRRAEGNPTITLKLFTDEKIFFY